MLTPRMQRKFLRRKAVGLSEMVLSGVNDVFYLLEVGELIYSRDVLRMGLLVN